MPVLRDLEVDFEVLVSSADVLAPLLRLFPDAEWWAEGGRGGSSAKGDDPSAHLPVRLTSWAAPPEAVGPFLGSRGGSPATVRWDFTGWPAAPEVGLGDGGARGAFVTPCVNARDLELEEPATDLRGEVACAVRILRRGRQGRHGRPRPGTWTATL
ncbi:hypothetical protein [Streptomyces cyaneofuscatus]